MVKKLPVMVVDGWIVDINVLLRVDADSNYYHLIHVTAEKGEFLFQFCLRMDDSSIGNWREINLTPVVIFAGMCVKIMAVNFAGWYSETDLPLYHFGVTSYGSNFGIKLKGITCECSPCKYMAAALERNEKAIEDFRYGYATDGEASTPETQIEREPGRQQPDHLEP